MKTYATPASFAAALEERVKRAAADQHRPINRVRTLLVMERFLARVLDTFPDTTMLKGGLALELRLSHARTTRDIDLRALGAPRDAEPLLRKAAATVPSPDDFLRFKVEPDPDHPTISGEGVVHDGFRFDVRATLAGRPYADRFGVDVAYADVVHGDATELVGTDLLAFIGVPPLRARAYPVPSHLAEKLHAYTMPRLRPNSRVKDLADIALLGTLDGHDARDLNAAFRETFAFRGTHPVPTSLPDPPPDWADRYRRIAQEEQLAWSDLASVLAAARAFVDPVLAGADGAWDAAAWTWR